MLAEDKIVRGGEVDREEGGDLGREDLKAEGELGMGFSGALIWTSGENDPRGEVPWGGSGDVARIEEEGGETEEEEGRGEVRGEVGGEKEVLESEEWLG